MQTSLINNPVISIGMPVYNGEKYIKEAICSILKQSFTDFELIISDNCSADKTQEICAKYVAMDSRIRYLKQVENIGVVGNFEFTLHQAHGQFFMWMACDDYLENENYLLTIVNKIQEGYDFCFPQIKLLWESTKTNVTKVSMDRFSKCITNYDYCKETVHICSFQIYGVFKRVFLIDNFKYIQQCKDLRLFAEGLFVHAITSSSLLAYVPSAKLIYRKHATNISSIQSPTNSLVDFFKFSYRLTFFYIGCKSFTFLQKIPLVISIFYVHGRYFLVLISSFFPKTRKLLSKLTKLISGDSR